MFLMANIMQKILEKKALLKQLKVDKEFEEWTVEMGRKVNKNIAKKRKKKRLL